MEKHRRGGGGLKTRDPQRALRGRYIYIYAQIQTLKSIRSTQALMQLLCVIIQDSRMGFYLLLKGVELGVCDLPGMLLPQSFGLRRLLRTLVQTERLDHVLEEFPANTQSAVSKCIRSTWSVSVNEMRIYCVCFSFIPLCAGPDVDVCDYFDFVVFDPELLHKQLHSDGQLQ